jgi:hypothetical protein
MEYYGAVGKLIHEKTEAKNLVTHCFFKNAIRLAGRHSSCQATPAVQQESFGKLFTS